MGTIDPDKVRVVGTAFVVEFEYGGNIYYALRGIDMNSGKNGTQVVLTKEELIAVFVLSQDPDVPLDRAVQAPIDPPPYPEE